jgi:hypothetical protein
MGVPRRCSFVREDDMAETVMLLLLLSDCDLWNPATPLGRDRYKRACPRPW